MTTIEIPIPRTLYDRIAMSAEEIGMTTESLAGLWLWEIEVEKRIHGNGRSGSRSAIGRDDGDLPTGQDD